MTNDIMPYDLDQLAAFCERLVRAKSTILPQEYHEGFKGQSAEEAVGKLLAVTSRGAECGLSPWAAVDGLYSPAAGKVGFQSSTLVALLKKAGYRVTWPKDAKQDETSATVRLTDPHGEVHDETFDLARASRMVTTYYTGYGQNRSKNRGPLPQKWKSEGKDPFVMLRYRALSAAVRVFAADVTTFPAYTVDELEDQAEDIKQADARIVDESDGNRSEALIRVLRDAPPADAEHEQEPAEMLPDIPEEPDVDPLGDEPEPEPEAPDWQAEWKMAIDGCLSSYDMLGIVPGIRALPRDAQEIIRPIFKEKYDRLRKEEKADDAKKARSR